MLLISGLERLLGWERFPFYVRYGCVEMTKKLMKKLFTFEGYVQMYRIFRLWSPL
jgi:hypothetical protein